VRYKKITDYVFVIIVIGILAFTFFRSNFQEGARSDIDNTVLPSNPLANWSADMDLTAGIDHYVNMRIGFREEMIDTYMKLNDFLWDELNHRNYFYGIDKEIFSKGDHLYNYDYEYIDIFAKFVVDMAHYCESRGIEFWFSLSPGKVSVETDKLMDGYNYDGEWIVYLLNRLSEGGVRYVDNNSYMKELYIQGVSVYNHKADPGHWNDLGAFYGVNNILNSMQQVFPEIHINSLDEYEVESVLVDKLALLSFQINEKVPQYSLKVQPDNITSQYWDEIEMNWNFCAFGYYQNKKRIQEKAPKVLSIQGSHLNGIGYKFMCNAFSDYIYVHSYFNAINYEYYINIFQPDVLLFEVTEGTIDTAFFPKEQMSAKALKPTINQAKDLYGEEMIISDNVQIKCKNGVSLSTISSDKLTGESVWLVIDGVEYDCTTTENGFQVKVKRETLENCNFIFVELVKEGMLYKYNNISVEQDNS